MNASRRKKLTKILEKLKTLLVKIDLGEVEGLLEQLEEIREEESVFYSDAEEKNQAKKSDEALQFMDAIQDFINVVSTVKENVQDAQECELARLLDLS